MMKSKIVDAAKVKGSDFGLGRKASIKGVKRAAQKVRAVSGEVDVQASGVQLSAKIAPTSMTGYRARRAVTREELRAHRIANMFGAKVSSDPLDRVEVIFSKNVGVIE